MWVFKKKYYLNCNFIKNDFILKKTYILFWNIFQFYCLTLHVLCNTFNFNTINVVIIKKLLKSYKKLQNNLL